MFPDTLAYILVLMLSSIDFWVVKNIVGRKLVKMRWWFIIDNDGNERWYYESKECNHLFQDKMVFWGTLYLTPAVWLLFSVMNAITFAIFKVKAPFLFFIDCNHRNLSAYRRRPMVGLQKLQGRS